jgi:hypothetical protein
MFVPSFLSSPSWPSLTFLFICQSDFLVPQLYRYGAETSWKDIAWEDKSDTFVWRGGMTGVTYPGSK